MLLLKLLRQTFGEKIVEIIAAQAVVSVAGQHLRDVAFHGDHGDVESSAAQVVDQRRMARPVAVAIREARGRGLVQNAHYFQPASAPASRVALRCASEK